MTVWLLTFLVHSTLWLGLAWLLTQMLPSMHARTRETMWHTAIMTSLVVPGLHVLAPERFASVWALTLPGALLSSERGLSTAEHVARFSASGTGWQTFSVSIWFAIAGAMLLFSLVRHVAVRWTIQPQEVGNTDHRLVALTSLSKDAGLTRPPRLTESDNLGSPVALGFGTRAEICVPTRAFHELDHEQFRAMLGHEVAHHMRRDPVRLAISNGLRSLFWFQPLLHIGARHVYRAAEEQCDEWAARRTGDPLALASCLTEVARWVLASHRRLPVVGMAHGHSQLHLRVDRLLDEKRHLEPGNGMWPRIGSVAVLLMAPWIAPAMAPASELPHDVPPADATVVAPPVRNTEHGGRTDGDGERHGTEPDRDDSEHGREDDRDDHDALL